MATETVEYRILEPQAPGYQFSTGPKSAAGKARASMNALKRGLRSKKIILPAENREEFDDFRQALIDDLRPVGPEETVLADAVAGLHWRMLRMDRAEVDLLSTRPEAPEAPVSTEMMEVDPKTHMTRGIRRVQRTAQEASEPPTLAEAIRANAHELALIVRYRGETRRELAQTRGELRKLQTERKAREKEAEEFKRKAALPDTPEFLKAMRLEELESARKKKDLYEEAKALGSPLAAMMQPPLWTFAPEWVDPEGAMAMEKAMAEQMELRQEMLAAQVAAGKLTQEQADAEMEKLAAQQMAVREGGY